MALSAMFQFAFFAAFSVLCCLRITDAFSWKSCSANPDDDIIQVKEFKITPEIISLDGSVTLSAVVDVKKQLDGPIRVQEDLQKSSGLLGGQAIPCHGKFGSCTFANACSEFPKLCPITSGVHTVQGYTYKLPPISAFVRWMAEGDYTGKITISDSEGNQLACISLSIQVVAGSS
ncbi:hypothetical protein BV898_10835 [Hypsibius exemplaris]|uniref:MD-2-related lipid-recognition domain-containing protein n=1 Tax=Hypsibius exemplaris TaxID=2072580 RepID=A0A1W0WI97_HYPEX|nr:hypothetical protein BV898_10835 [Hypsibius exemplaris]